MSSDLRAQFKNVTNLPTPPVIAAQVITLAHRPEVSLSDVAEAITCDASLTMKVMRVANSPMYAQRRKCSNLRQALVVLGLNATVTLALGFSLLPMLRRSPSKNKHLTHTWRRCVLSAVAARVMSDTLGATNSEEAFLAALLQDIGILAIDRVQPDFYSECNDYVDQHEKLCALEKTEFGVDHAVAGSWLLEQWDLPEYLREAVFGSHTLKEMDADDPSFGLNQCVAMSGLVADLWLSESDDDADFTRVSDQMESSLGIDRETCAMVMSEIGNNIPDMAVLFETELVSEQEAQMIVERAHEVLTLRNLKSINEVTELGKKTKQLTTLAQDLQEEQQRDSLTRVASRSHLDELLAKGFSHAKRFGWTLSIAFVDLDNFKQVNDTYGHQAGDDVLRNIATLLSRQLRASDAIGRFGGEEFIMILPGADEHGAKIVGERVLNAVRKLTHDVGGGKLINVTTSIGSACLTHGKEFETVSDFIGAADKALYLAKDQGRNRLVHYGQERSVDLVKLA